MGPWVQQKPLEKANLGFEQGTIGVMEARPWTPLSTMPPPGEAWSIAMHKQSFTHYWFNTKKRKKNNGGHEGPDFGQHSLLCRSLEHCNAQTKFHTLLV